MKRQTHRLFVFSFIFVFIPFWKRLQFGTMETKIRMKRKTKSEAAVYLATRS